MTHVTTSLPFWEQHSRTFRLNPNYTVLVPVHVSVILLCLLVYLTVINKNADLSIGTRLHSSLIYWFVVNDTACRAASLHSDQNDVIIIGGGGRDRSDPPQRRTASFTSQHSAAQRSTVIPINAGGSSSLSNNSVTFLHIAPKTWTGNLIPARI